MFLFVVTSLYSFAQDIEAPKNLQATWQADSGVINISWDHVNEEIAGYHLFVKKPGQNRMYLWSPAGQLENNSYIFKVTYRTGGVYNFTVAAFRNFPQLVYGKKAKEKSVSVPTFFLPMVGDIKTRAGKGGLNITWEYPYEIPDLGGFELQLNDSTIQLGKNQHEYYVKDMVPATYKLVLRAFTVNGIRSDDSSIKVIRVK